MKWANMSSVVDYCRLPFKSGGPRSIQLSLGNFVLRAGGLDFGRRRSAVNQTLHVWTAVSRLR